MVVPVPDSGPLRPPVWTPGGEALPAPRRGVLRVQGVPWAHVPEPAGAQVRTGATGAHCQAGRSRGGGGEGHDEAEDCVAADLKSSCAQVLLINQIVYRVFCLKNP